MSNTIKYIIMVSLALIIISQQCVYYTQYDMLMNQGLYILSLYKTIEIETINKKYWKQEFINCKTNKNN